MARGSWFVARGSWFVVRGSWFVVRGSWFVVRGSWFVGAAQRAARLSYQERLSLMRLSVTAKKGLSHNGKPFSVGARHVRAPTIDS